MRELAELAEARGALEPERVIAALARAFELWRAPDAAWRGHPGRPAGRDGAGVVA